MCRFGSCPLTRIPKVYERKDLCKFYLAFNRKKKKKVGISCVFNIGIDILDIFNIGILPPLVNVLK